LDRQKILMCAPDHYGVDYVINPWMEGNQGSADRILAWQQWAALRLALEKHAEIALIPQQDGLPDQVFTANAGLVLGDTAVVSRFRAKERQGEEPLFRAWFEKNGFTVADWPRDITFEGAGDALLDRGKPIIWAGHGFRSDAAAPAFLEKIFGRRAIALKLVNPRFYHLDTCLCPLAGGTLMYFPGAFDEDSRKEIERIVPAEKRIAVDSDDAQKFACNAVDLDGHVFLNDASESLQGRLRQSGFAPIITPLSEFMKAGGAAKCLTLKLVEK
jgi:N-dimethylarginine dimethylaminohydrolase